MCKRMRRALIFFGLIIYSICLNAQIPSTQGTEFWLTFMWNYQNSATTRLILSAKNATTGTVSNPNTSWSTNFSIPAHGRVEVTIPNAQCYITSTEQILNKGILVQANDTISVYAANYYAYTFDATNVLPIQALGDEHIIATYNGMYSGSEFAIVATQNNTVIDITPSVATQGGHSANSTFTITLNRGQVYQVISSSATGDLSKSKVMARDCKKIAVFAGCRCTNIPNGCPYCDHIVEQTWPVFSWGKEFVVTGSLTRSQDRVRITASVNGTQVYRNGSLLTTLNAGNSYELTMTSSTPAIYISATQPVCVYLYIVGSSCGGSNGDPSSVWISPVEQRIQEVTFGTFSPGQTLKQYINVITPTAGKNSARLDGNSISSQFSTVPGNTTYSYARILISHGTHTITCDSGVVAHIYGLGTDESYAYSAGSSAANLKSKMFVNDVSSVDISALQEYCYGDSIFFKANVQMAYDSIIWEFGDGTIAGGDSIHHLYPTYGIYLVNMIIDRRSTNNKCGGFDTISTIVRILQNDTIIKDTICAGLQYNSNGFSLLSNNDTTISKKFATVWGCDSIVTLQLTVNPVYNINLTDKICQGDLYSKNGFTVDSKDSASGTYTYTQNLLTANGCDSTIVLSLTINPSYDIEIYDTTCQDLLPYTMYDFNVSLSGTYTKNLLTSKGCDSTVTLHLHVHPSKVTKLSASICQGSAYTLNGFNESTTGIFVQHLNTIHGCDSTVYLDLQVYPIDPIHIPVSICQGDSYQANNFSVSGYTPGHFSYTNYDISSIGCDSTTILDVTVLPLPQPNLGHDITICNSNQFPIVLNAGQFNDYHWSTGDTTQFISAYEEGTYAVTVGSGVGCTATDMIEIADKHLEVTIEQGIDFCEGYVTTLTAITDAPNILWSNGETDNTITIHDNGSYTVNVSNDHCSSTAHINIAECPFEIYVPNTFSPYVQDGINDFFSISGNTESIAQFKIYIYDRWGKLVFESDDVNFKWDGKVDGAYIPNHTFSWVIKLATTRNKKQVLKGHVNVL